MTTKSHNDSNHNLLIDFGGLAPFKYLQTGTQKHDSRRANILVFPRSLIERHSGFVKWLDAGPIVRAVEKESRWMPRADAERSKNWVQPIPCALIRNNNHYSVLQRVSDPNKPNLCSRISLIVGGHVDQTEEHRSFLTLLFATLRRELDEEIGVETFPGSRVGVVIDSSSLDASRHVGFVYEVIVSESFKTRASEEFSLGSKLTGVFFSKEELCRFSNKFDPWSSLIFENHIARDLTKQRSQWQINLPGI